MTGNNKQPQQKKTGDSNKSDLSPLILSPTRNRRNEHWAEDELLAEDDPLASNPPRPHTSSIRWTIPTTGRRGTETRDVSLETTHQQIPVPPRRTAQAYIPSTGPVQARSRRNTTFQRASSTLSTQIGEQRKIHWMLYVGVGMLAALAMWVTASSLLAWGTTKYNDIIYGNPRIFQTDQVVGHNNDSPAHPSHFIALNLHGQVIIIELPAGDPTKSIDYIGPDLIAAGDEQIPVTLTFSDVNKDGKPVMIVHIQDKEVHFCNNGTKFTACS
jgi:hypothetical protein